MAQFARGKKIKCINTNTVFTCLLDAAHAANVTPSLILSSIKCNGAAGVFEDGTRLQWALV